MRNKSHGWIFTCAVILSGLLFSGCWAGATDQLVPDATSSSSSSSSSSMGEIPAVTVSSTYRLSPYDVIDCSVYGEEDLHTRARLGSDGTVVLPLIGNIDLDGKTVLEANELIEKKYADGFVKNPHVLLTVIEYRKNTFSIIGQVIRPGIYEIPEGTHMTVVDAILLAGGFTRIADQNGVRIKRMVHGKAQIFKVKAGAMADSSNVAPFDIEANDVITVKESWW
jgi:polysaccharide export outer membrane protein